MSKNITLFTLLALACSHSAYSMQKMSIQDIEDINEFLCEHNFATLEQDPEVIRATDSRKMTPLHLAAKEGRIDIVTVLIDLKADINALDSLKRTPLHWAAFTGRLEVVQLLIERGANANISDQANSTPFELAYFSRNPRHLHIVEFLRPHTLFFKRCSVQ